MTDLALTLDSRGADLVLAGDDLLLDEGLEAPVLVSLFSDARATEEQDLPGGEGSGLRGWWGADEGEAFGSLLWLSERSKVTDETVNMVREAVRDGLAWLIEEEIVASLEVSAERTDLGTIIVQARLARGTSRRWEALWQAIRNATFSAGSVQVHLLAA